MIAKTRLYPFQASSSSSVTLPVFLSKCYNIPTHTFVHLYMHNIHSSTNSVISFFFGAEKYSFLYMCKIIIVHSSVINS